MEEREREVRRMRNRTRREGGGWANRCFALTLFLHRVRRPPDAGKLTPALPCPALPCLRLPCLPRSYHFNYSGVCPMMNHDGDGSFFPHLTTRMVHQQTTSHSPHIHTLDTCPAACSVQHPLARFSSPPTHICAHPRNSTGTAALHHAALAASATATPSPSYMISWTAPSHLIR